MKYDLKKLQLTEFDVLYLRCLLGGTDVHAMTAGVVDPTTLRFLDLTPEQEGELRANVHHHGSLYFKFCEATGT